ncbi:hypothetical protein J1G42_00150 [Cellulomonas sp. zg-ZUI222]|uniref:Asp23/Gls24 family envelope stress response protein n=1 Tax=Cellulomonas wangleii TaxID=2816956 RepID=A0ABX8D6X7_9CELL|nr:MULTISPECIES: hypothetical protein [Cellulomonas]MBO0898377.1 hypothetical protein [Cellulomonas sp. zg-ZUI22]MBO0919238.1 hypothetical protein [Cellulomonas wangleii]MBO0924613.1 hypothetical protein [Cellulomonas wangleii]QVI62590.1 hypothetical protein KG103_01145 [Cellulomonas wangleii]
MSTDQPDDEEPVVVAVREETIVVVAPQGAGPQDVDVVDVEPVADPADVAAQAVPPPVPALPLPPVAVGGAAAPPVPGPTPSPSPGPSPTAPVPPPRPPDPAERAAAAALAVPGVAGLYGGAFGEIATHLPGRRVAGVRSRRTPDGARTEVHVVARLGGDLRELAATVHQRVHDAVGGQVHVVVDDLAP